MLMEYEASRMSGKTNAVEKTSHGHFTSGMQSLSPPNQLPIVDFHMASFWPNMLCPRN